jgi:ubiquinone/menaquinone biosynthesis C-methylase UbiE
MIDTHLIPPTECLFDGAISAEEFVEVGEGFTREYLIQRAKLRPDDRVLDLGSGNGQKARVLTRHLNASGSYEGLDIVRSGIEWCQNAYALYPNFNFTLASDIYNSHYNPQGWVMASEYRLPYNDSEFDLVFCSSLFTHLVPAETDNYIKQISRVLMSGGRCVATAFLINADTEKIVDSGSVRFPVACDGYRVRDAENPSSAVALPEAYWREIF